MKNLTKYSSFFDDPNFPLNTGKSGWPWSPVQFLNPQAVPASDFPRITVITPSFNQGQFIEETIRSVLLQGYPNLEYIIIDGGSTDDSVEIIKKYEPWLAYWVSEADQGQSYAINKGIKKATGDWIAWLNADDIYLQNAFFKIATTISQSTKPLSWIVGTTVFTDLELHEIGRFEPSMYTAPGRDLNYEPAGWIDFVLNEHAGIALPQPSSFWLRRAVIQAGGIDESLRFDMDHELYGRLAYQGFRPLLIEDVLAYFRVHQAQKSSNYPLLFWKEELKVVNNWSNRVKGIEKEKLENYWIWLNRKIKYYPLRIFIQSMKSRFKKIRNFLDYFYKRI